MIVKCGNCGTDLGEHAETTAIICPECAAVTQFIPKQANLAAAYSQPEPSEPEPVEPPPDGTRIMCPVCDRNLLGVWQGGVLQIKHQGKEWMTTGGTVAIRCHPKCGGLIQIDTRVYEVSIVSSFGAFLESVGIVQEVDATEGALLLANKLGIPLTDVTGTGKDGRITQPDVRAYAEQLESSKEDRD